MVHTPLRWTVLKLLLLSPVAEVIEWTDAHF